MLRLSETYFSSFRGECFSVTMPTCTTCACYSKQSNYCLALFIITDTTAQVPFTVGTADSDAFDHCCAFLNLRIPYLATTQ